MQQIKKLLGLDGVAMINKALAIFEKVKEALLKGIASGRDEIVAKVEQIDKNTKEKNEIETQVKKAENVLKKIEELLG